ncbi:hypothetical protein [Bradyrhizobium zhanjiangense]|uniref:hypothetical protein n=1 Tax=Bradyrhizobium zhanjiangense TaxID=1325107 RepID=UPI0013E89B49|nr:hypothetical protein [Bradyrhizobium zhanjiangense]
MAVFHKRFSLRVISFDYSCGPGRITDAAGRGGKDVGACLAVCAHDKAGRREAGICAVGGSTAVIEFDAKHPAVLLPIVADLATCKERRRINNAAID